MKFDIKGIFLILILLSSSSITFSKEISHASRRAKLRKSFSKNKVKFTRFSHKRVRTSKKKSNEVKPATGKLTKEDWLSPKDLIPIAFLKGLCTQFESLTKVEEVIDYVLDPERLQKEAVDFVCNKINTKLVTGTFTGKDAGKPVNAKEKIVAALDSKTRKSKFKKFRTGENAIIIVQDAFNDFKKCTGEYKILLGGIAGKSVSYSKDEIELILAEINKPNQIKNVEIKEQTFTFAILNDRKEYDINGKTQFLNIKKAVPTLSDDAANEVKYVHLECLKDFVLDKILEINKAESDEEKYIKILDEKLNDDDLYIEVSSVEKTDKIEQLKSKTTSNECIGVVKKFYEHKKKEIVEMEKIKLEEAAKPTKEGTLELENLVSILFEFAYNFLKKVVTCVSDATIAEISQFALTKLVEISIKIITGLAAIKILWYLGKFTFFIINAAATVLKPFSRPPPEKKAGEPEKKVVEEEDEETQLRNAKREKGMEFGKAIGSLFNAILSAVGLTRRRFKKGKRRLNKN